MNNDSVVIVSNSIICNKCNDTIYSAHRHDYKECSCGAVAVDGGTSYFRRIGTDYADISIVMEEETINQCLAVMKWADDNKKNDRGKLYAILRVLRDKGVELNGTNEYRTTRGSCGTDGNDEGNRPRVC